MSNNIISSIYKAYLENEFEGIQALRCEDLQVAYANLKEFEKKHNISLSEHNDIETDTISETSNTSELKGFTNGFKLAVRLIFEVWGTSSHYIKQ